MTASVVYADNNKAKSYACVARPLRKSQENGPRQIILFLTSV